MRLLILAALLAFTTPALADHSPAHAGIGVTIRKPTCARPSFGVRVHNDLNQRITVSLILWRGGYDGGHLILRLRVPADGIGRAQVGPDWTRDSYKLGVFRGPRVFTPSGEVYRSRWLVNSYGRRCA